MSSDKKAAAAAAGRLKLALALAALGGASALVCGARPPASSAQEVWAVAARRAVRTQAHGRTGTPAGVPKLYRGTLGDRRVEMRLVRDGDRFGGSYSYDGIGQSLALRGGADAKGGFTLEEFEPGGRLTGRFACQKNEPAEYGVDIQCEWKRPDGGGRQYVLLTEQHSGFTNGLRVVPKLITNRKYKVSVSYPQLAAERGPLPAAAEAFNRAAYAAAEGPVKEFTQDETTEIGYTGNYNVLLATDQLVSVELDGEYCCGAHPEETYSALTFDLRAGRALKLADLFRAGSGFEEAIRRYCLAQIARQAAEIEKEEARSGGGSRPPSEESPVPEDEMKEVGAWALRPDGLMIYYNFPHVIAVFDRQFVPFGAVKEFLRPDGPAAPLARGVAASGALW